MSVSEASSGEYLDGVSTGAEYHHKSRQYRSRSVAGDMETHHDASPSTTARPRTLGARATAWTAVNKQSEQDGASHEHSLSDGADSQSDSGSGWPGEECDMDPPGRSMSSTPTPSLPTPSEYSIDISTLPDLPPPSGTARPRYSGPRRTTARYASGPPGRPLRFHRMGRSVADVWNEWMRGAHGNPPLGALEARYGTGWRAGTLQERKYGSNWVAGRRIVVDYVEGMCEDRGLTSRDAVQQLDDRVDGRMQELIKVLRAKKNPFEAIKERGQE
ncbi:Uncharacterized protein TCAP_07030 [Tolypocladium capitatum]|uniref:Transcription activator GCR1-like domain-containing protein n=1 Tax=Tolypocladium capitatum TaxID=45235 RepID=A0A2K3Q5Y0_9HYPO|nr:Uncharacterized protein TCAP_07030 [Tolypocladium capitatum]